MQEKVTLDVEQEEQRQQEKQDAAEKIRILAGLDPNAESFHKLAIGFLQNLDTEFLQKANRDDGSPCKYEPVLNRETVETAFGKLNELFQEIVVDNQLNLSQADLVLLRKQISTSMDSFQHHFNNWYDSESVMGNLESYMRVFGVTPSSQRSLRALALAYMRFTNWMPSFSENEAIRFLDRKATKSSSRKTYASYLRTIFKAQGIRKTDLPFSDTPLKRSANEKPSRKTFPFEKVVDFIQHVKMSGDARAAFYGVLCTTWGFRPIEMKKIGDKIDKENHMITVPTAKRGRERIHQIPEVVRPYLYDYQPEELSHGQMSRLWRFICRDIGWRPQGKRIEAGAFRGYSWYGMRHAVFTNLVNKSLIHPMFLDKWGGWNTGQASGAGMIAIYHSPSLGDMLKIDEEIIGKHPFLSYWNHDNARI